MSGSPGGRRVYHPYEATPPITKITLVADLVFCAGSWGCPRGKARNRGSGAGVVAREGTSCGRGGDVSNERVAAGFENHGIIRQIKLERLRPFFFPTPITIHTYEPPRAKWIRPCLLPTIDHGSLLITG